MNPYLLLDLAHAREHESDRRAARARLAAIARCCRPSELSRMVSAVQAAVIGQTTCC